MRNKSIRRCALMLALAFMLCIMSAGLYAGAKETMRKAEAVRQEAEDLFLEAEILHNQVKAAQEAAEAVEPEQVIVVEEKVIYAEALANAPEEPPLSCLEYAPAEPEPEKVSMGNYTVTAYCPCERCCGYWARTRPLDENGKPIVYTASGALAQAGVTIAVDPSVIPHGTSVWFEGPNGMNEYIAQDTGSSVNGYHIDLYCDSHEAALAWGAQTREVFREVSAK